MSIPESLFEELGFKKSKKYQGDMEISLTERVTFSVGLDLQYGVYHRSSSDYNDFDYLTIGTIKSESHLRKLVDVLLNY